MRVRTALIIVFLVGLAAHARSLVDGFVYDDVPAVVTNPTVQGAISPARLLQHDFWGAPPGRGTGTWRPLADLSLWIDRHLDGGSPLIFHVDNVLLHALVAVLLALAVARRRDAWAGLVAGVAFAGLAATTEAVAGIVGRADLLAAAFALLAWLAADSRRPALAGLALFAALLAKESALAAVVWILAIAVLDRRPRAELARLGAACALAAAAYLLLRAGEFGFAMRRDAASDPLVGQALGVRVLTGLALTTHALRTILVPIRLAPDYSFDSIPTVHALSVEVVTGALILVGGVVAIVRLRREPLAAAGLAIFVCTWFLASNILYPTPTIFAERLLYVPAAGLAIALAAAPRRPMATALLLVLVGANLVRGAIHDGDWHDDLSLWKSAVRAEPDDARAWENYGTALRARRHPAAAAAAFKRATAIRPDWPLPHAMDGLCLEDLGDGPDAERELALAFALDPDDVDAGLNLAVVLARDGKRDRARDVLHVLLDRHPDEPRARVLERGL